MYIYVFLLLFLFLHLSSLSPTFSLFSFIPYPSSFHLLLFLLPYYQSSKFIIFSQFERSKNFSVSFRKSTPLSILYLYSPIFSTLTPYSSFLLLLHHLSSLRHTVLLHVRHNPSRSTIHLANPLQPSCRPANTLLLADSSPVLSARGSAQVAACRQAVSTTEGGKNIQGGSSGRHHHQLLFNRVIIIFFARIINNRAFFTSGVRVASLYRILRKIANIPNIVNTNSSWIGTLSFFLSSRQD